jgi:hypothetical protein
MKINLFLLIMLLMVTVLCYAQSTTGLPSGIKFPNTDKYLIQIDNKIDKYTTQIANKTEKTLTKLIRWENKIKRILLKTSPDVAKELFGPNAITFSSILQKIKDNENLAQGSNTKYDAYHDKLTTSIKYITALANDTSRTLAINSTKLQSANNQLARLDSATKTNEAIAQFIKERRRQLLNEAGKFISNHKYLSKIDKDCYYYIETLKNLKDQFQDPKKAEALAFMLLNKIGAFKKFMQENSMLTSLFGTPSSTNGNMAGLAGLQTRSSVNNLLQSQIATGGPNAAGLLSQNIQQAQASLSKLKDDLLSTGGSSSDELNMPNFKPNTEKSKTFKQRIEYGGNYQIAKTNAYLPQTIDLAVSVGYKLNGKSVIGVGASYKLGIGNIRHVQLNTQGVGLRSYLDWKIKKHYYISGGYEINYLSQLPSTRGTLPFQTKNWQPSGLIGISKKVPVKTKLFKKLSFSLLYDILANASIPARQALLFRIGHQF